MTRQLTEIRSYSLTRTGVMRRASLRGPAPAVPFRNRSYVPQKAAGSFVPAITKAAFEKFGFPASALLTDWSRIAGTDIAGYTMPERLKWARKAEGAAEDDESSAGRPGAQLVLRVDPARALDVSYKTQILIDRINQYFGYPAVGSIKVVQGSIPGQSETAPAPGASTKAKVAAGQHTLPPHPDAVHDPLDAALAKLGAHVANRKST